MPENFLNLSPDDRREALEVAATQTGRPVHILEKDAMVVWAVDGLFKSPVGRHLVFKGGTSLSKGYGTIKRFSEDIDVTYDVRELIPDLASGEHPLPATTSQAKKWRKAIDEKLPAWVTQVVLPILQNHAAETGIHPKLTVEGANLLVDYEDVAEGYGYVPPVVKIEFGARSTGEPSEPKEITCDAAGHVEGVVFPAATPRLMLPKRTFWEKATAVHVFCKQAINDDDHISRHWHDLVRLDDAGYATDALNDRALAEEVAAFKAKFHAANDRAGERIDYTQAVSGGLQLVPQSDQDKAILQEDYQKMADAGFLLDDIESFENLMTRCHDIQARANAT